MNTNRTIPTFTTAQTDIELTDMLIEAGFTFATYGNDANGNLLGWFCKPGYQEARSRNDEAKMRELMCGNNPKTFYYAARIAFYHHTELELS